MHEKRSLVVSVAALLSAALPGIASASAPASLGGGSLPPAALGGGPFAPTVGMTLQPRAGGRIAVAFDTTLRCGRRTVPVRVHRVLTWDGATLQGSGARRVRFGQDAVAVAWILDGRVQGQTGYGAIRIAAHRRGRACAGRAPRPFVVRLGPAPAGRPALPAAGSALYGSSRHRLRRGVAAPVVLRVSAGRRRVAARWAVAAHCTGGGRERFTNFTPPARIGAGARFERRERFAVRYTNAYVRYRVAFRGRFLADGARGRLRLRATVLDRRGGRVMTRCDTGRRGWTAWTGGEPAAVAPPGTEPGGAPPQTPPPDPQFRPAPTVGAWSLDMTSDPGEYIGQGRPWHLGSAFGESLVIDVFAAGDIVQFNALTRDGDHWSGGFSSGTGAPLRTGTYTAIGGAGSPWLGIGGQSRGCGHFMGWFAIAALAYDPNGALRTLRLSFEAHCEGLPEALRGQFAFDAA